MNKAKKLISRSLENPEVARAARSTSDLLCRISLGQASIVAELVIAAFPELTLEEQDALAYLFRRVSDYFLQSSKGLRPDIGYEDRIVRNWKSNTEFFYDLHRLFCVVACDHGYCAEYFNCWETRGAFCREEKPRVIHEDWLTECGFDSLVEIQGRGTTTSIWRFEVSPFVEIAISPLYTSAKEGQPLPWQVFLWTRPQRNSTPLREIQYQYELIQLYESLSGKQWRSQ